MTAFLSVFAAIAIGVLAIMGVMLAWKPTLPPATNAAIAFESAISADYTDLPPLEAIPARDGQNLWFRQYEPKGTATSTLVLVHGSAWHGMQFHQLARAIVASGPIRVIVPDMRGHGEHAAPRGDVAYISQLEDDIADLISHIRQDSPTGAIRLVGHSSGGGFVLRFAGGNHGSMVDGFALLAPFLRHDAPTTRAQSGGWAHPSVPRIIALGLLNALGMTQLNHLPVLAFNMPPSVLDGPMGHTVTTQYSYSMQTGFAAHPDYGADLSAADRNLLVLVGTEDEAFIAQAYPAVVERYAPQARVEIIPGATHIGLLTSNETFRILAEWVSSPN